jgi:hypothetical protein
MTSNSHASGDHASNFARRRMANAQYLRVLSSGSCGRNTRCGQPTMAPDRNRLERHGKENGPPGGCNACRRPNSLDHSITSSARPSGVTGEAMPSVFAVWRLRVSSTLVDCWTGRSAGLPCCRSSSRWRRGRLHCAPRGSGLPGRLEGGARSRDLPPERTRTKFQMAVVSQASIPSSMGMA